MKITKSQLKQIIKEEISLVREAYMSKADEEADRNWAVRARSKRMPHELEMLQRTRDARMMAYDKSDPASSERRMAAIKKAFLEEMYHLLLPEFATDDNAYNEQVLKPMIEKIYDQLLQASLDGQREFNKNPDR